MPGFAADTSCIVAALCSWHSEHAAAFAEIDRRLRAAEPMIVAAPALVESYAVLTRLPPPHRIAARDAFAALDASFARGGKVVALDAPGYRDLLETLAGSGVSGGRTYDAVILQCALKGGATTVLTLNPRDFEALAEGRLAVVVPRGKRK